MADETKTKSEFEQFTWKGQVRYKCNKNWEGGVPCEYDTYDLAAMKVHLRDPHSRTGTDDRLMQPRSPIMGPDGKPMLSPPVPADLADTHFKKS